MARDGGPGRAMSRAGMALRRTLRRGYQSALTAGVVAWAAGARLLPARRPAGAPKKILVLRGGLLGDAVLLTPALRLLRASFPEATIHVLASPIQCAVLEPLPLVDRVIVWKAGDLWEPRLGLQLSRWAVAGRAVEALRRERYDMALSCYGPLGSALALLSGAPERIGFAGEALPGTLTRALPGERWTHPWHDAEYNVEIVRAAGASGETPAPMVVVGEGDRERAASLVGSSDGRPLVMLHTGATNGRAKRWPAEHWRALARRLADEGARIAAVGAGEEDEALARGLVTNPALNLVNRTTLGELFAVLERADVVVTGDSGPMHVATALGRPVVALFGPTDPAIYAPFKAAHATVLRHAIPCAPCYRLDRVADCPLGHTLCQRLLEPQTVHAAVRAMLEGQREPAGEPMGEPVGR